MTPVRWNLTIKSSSRRFRRFGVCSLSLTLLVLMSLTACQMPRVGFPHHVVGSTYQPHSSVSKMNCTQPGDLQELCLHAKTNQQESAWYQENEWPYNRTNSDELPLVCVSLSGGGIRSAAFAIGVMKGLSEVQVDGTKKSILDHVDILSGTSGGSYAVSWYYMQHLQNKTDLELFADQGASQTYLQTHADFMDLGTYSLSGFFNVVLMSPINALVNGIFGAHWNTNFIGNALYQKKVRTTFYSEREATLIDLRHYLKTHQKEVPYFIITATSRIDESNFHADALLRNTVFEFTPLRVGNDGFTYMNPDHFAINHLDIARIVTIAGAAPDSSQVITGSSRRFLSSIANVDYGQYIYNYNDTRHELRRNLTKLSPFPLYLLTEAYNHDLWGSDIYLSDGGHQENLAAYPLIRRQCQNIIMVDGEFDEHYEFESYFKLKANVERELRVDMSLTPTTYCVGFPRDSKCKDNNVDAIVKALQDAAEYGTTRAEAEALGLNAARCCFSGQHPIMEGKIGYVPMLYNDQVEWQHINLVYVKLSLDTYLFDDWANKSPDQKKMVYDIVGEKAAEYYATVKNETCKARYWRTCAFPQYSTAYQSFTSNQFEAYVDLGATMIKRRLKMDGTRLYLNDSASIAGY